MADPSQRKSRIAEFVRGYFVWLEERGISAALLHGWEDTFEGDISDIDYVIESVAFRNVAATVNEYCAETSWRLCQVLRHEDTAAFCVCSAIDDPACVVALDACSDYQRSGRLLLTATDLLRDRKSLDWGGFRLSPAMEFRYRFIKAAAKDKQAEEVVPDMLAMGEEARIGFGDWLQNSWGVALERENLASLSSALSVLSARCRSGNTKYRILSLGRIVRRTLKPDGLLLLTNDKDAERLQPIIETFSGLYFRRHLCVPSASPGNRIDLIRSVLVIASQMKQLTSIGLDPDCILSAHDSFTPDWLASKLHERCKRRERL
ncbi:MAG: hypothetical protein ABJQ29_12780 [Luteolibacter sp.]